MWNYESGYQESGLLNVSGFQLDKITDVVIPETDPDDFKEGPGADAFWISVFELASGLNAKDPGQR